MSEATPDRGPTRWAKAGLAGVLAALLILWGWYYVSPRWTLRQMRAAALAHDQEGLSAFVDYPALRASTESEQRSNAAKLMALAPAEVRDRVEADIERRMTADAVDRVSGPEWIELIFGRDPYPGWASGAPDTGRSERIAVRSPDLFQLHDRADPYPRPAGDLTFRRRGLGWKLIAIGPGGEEFPEKPPPAWWRRVLDGYGLRRRP
jgi:hypothetical protein